MSINEIKDFIFENYYKRIGFSKKISYNSVKCLNKKDLLLLPNKLMKNMPDPCNAKEHSQSFTIKKNIKSVKQSKTITCEPKTFDTADKKSVFTKHPKTLNKLSKTIRQAEIVGSNSSLYRYKKK